jgi:hypothetical protein
MTGAGGVRSGQWRFSRQHHLPQRTPPDLELVTDLLEVELQIFKERVEFLLLLPEYSEAVLPWRKLLNGEQHPSGGRQATDRAVQP